MCSAGLLGLDHVKLRRPEGCNANFVVNIVKACRLNSQTTGATKKIKAASSIERALAPDATRGAGDSACR